MINKHDTPTRLRLLAKDIEDGNPPPYVVAVLHEDEVFHALNTGSDPFAVVGMLEFEKLRILRRAEDD